MEGSGILTVCYCCVTTTQTQSVILAHVHVDCRVWLGFAGMPCASSWDDCLTGLSSTTDQWARPGMLFTSALRLTLGTGVLSLPK